MAELSSAPGLAVSQLKVPRGVTFHRPEAPFARWRHPGPAGCAGEQQDMASNPPFGAGPRNSSSDRPWCGPSGHLFQSGSARRSLSSLSTNQSVGASVASLYLSDASSNRLSGCPARRHLGWGFVPDRFRVRSRCHGSDRDGTGRRGARRRSPSTRAALLDEVQSDTPAPQPVAPRDEGLPWRFQLGDSSMSDCDRGPDRPFAGRTRGRCA